MPPKTYHNTDADLSLLDGKTIAVLGYGSQGHAQALNLRDSGCRVVVAQPPDRPNFRRAVQDGFQPVSTAEATRLADLIAVLTPDELMPGIFQSEIRPHLVPGKTLVFAHGFNVRFKLIDVPEGVSTVLVAPLGPGPMVRSEFVRGRGVPCLIATADGAGIGVPLLGTSSAGTDRRGTEVVVRNSRKNGIGSSRQPPPSPSPCEQLPDALVLALAYAKGIGCTRAAAFETTFAEETETDLFGEQAVLCGGLGSLVQAAFETLVEAGYQPEIAYFTCVHEVKLIVDMIHRHGMNFMWQNISNTAEYGAYTRGPRIVSEPVKAEMRRILEEIRDGRFARQWIEVNRTGAAALEALRHARQNHPIEEVGRRVREQVFGGDGP
jgi:ketol-acid reductoisomerase